MGLQSISRPSRRQSFFVLLPTLALGLAVQILATAAFSQTIATTVPLILPSAVIFDAQGNLYIAETANHTVRKVDPTDQISTVAGTGTQGYSGDGGPATQAQLDSPQGLALDTKHLYIADTHNNRIRSIDLATGLITTIAGGKAGFDGDSGPATAAHLNQPNALAVDSDGNIYIADSQNHRIRKITSAGVISTIAGTGVEGFSGDGGAAVSAALDAPAGLAVDSDKNLYIADTHNNRIRKVSASTGIISTIAGIGSPSYSGDGAQASNAGLALPHGLTVDAAGNLYLADTANHRVRRIATTTGIITTIAGGGVQRFSGDGGPADKASLDTPRSPAISPASLPVIADTGNERVRQLSDDASIHTIAGLGTTAPGALTLSGPSVTAYGSGRLTATLTTLAGAQGSITFLDTTPSTATTTIGSASLTANAAVFDLSTLPAGTHNLTATYAGDQAHPSAQSSALAVSITPLQITATIAPSTVLYGQSIPSLTGTLSGVLARDKANLTAAFTTTASTLSPAGSYPITVALTGSAAGNYTVGPIPALTITVAPTTTTLTAPPATANPNQPITLTAHVTSATTGSPTGTIALLDGGVPQLTTSITSTGDATFTISSLSSGSHALSAIYSGDANFTPSASTTYPLGITNSGPSPADFTLTPSGAASQSATAGTSVSFSFTAQVQGAASLSSPITLAASGLPQFATASFNPTYIPPGSAASSFTLTINIPKSNLNHSGLSIPSQTMVVILLPLLGLGRRKIRVCALFTITTSIAAMLSGCGDRIYSGSQSSSGAKPYTITVTGTATTQSGTVLQHAANVVLILQQN
jgi:sugar lactone lactonase YvrE